MREFPADVEYAEQGEGPALLLLPGSFGTGAGWKLVIDRLAQRYRIVTTSLLGYGATAERRPLGNTSMQQQTDVIDHILERIGEPAHVIAHSFGGLAAIAHAIEGNIKPASLLLVEATPFALLKAFGDTEHFAMFGAMTRAYFAEYAAGRVDAAQRVIDFYGGAGTFDAMPAKVRDYVIRTTPTNLRDWSSGTPFDPPLSAYLQIAVKTLVVRGGTGHPAMMRIGEVLAEAIPGSRLESIAGGSHFLPTTHPAELARLLDTHVEQAITGAVP